MKKSCIIFILLFIIILTAVVCGRGKEELSEVNSCEYFRIHIRADSNDEDAQSVKYQVRDAVVEFLTPVLAESENKEQAMRSVEYFLPKIEEVANGVLRKNGFTYVSVASVKREEFPLRVYEEATLPKGEYDALILNLGSGKGDNWWCVIYPPLCFSGQGNVVYKSKIAEIIQKFYD